MANRLDLFATELGSINMYTVNQIDQIAYQIIKVLFKSSNCLSEITFIR